jgi:hypothetical protein
MTPHFAFRVDKWTADGSVEHIAGIEDLTVALATYHAACKRWPGATITLRQGAHVIEDNQRSRLEHGAGRLAHRCPALGYRKGRP